MTDLILHHYPQSLFSEKARAMLNARGIAWKSCIIPMIMPRPDTIPLTGGYRRTPVLQWGADIYCDSAAIAQLAETLGSGPSLYPAASRLAAQTLARWIDTELFHATVTIRFQPQHMGSFFADGEAAAAFAKDRAAFSQGSTARRASLDESLARYAGFLAEAEAQLSDGRRYLFGAEWSIADFAAYHVVWFVHGGGILADLLARHPAVSKWFAMMKAYGKADIPDISGQDALDVALATAPMVIESASDLADIPVGTLVDVAPVDYGVMPSRGELVRCDLNEIVIARSDERTGPVQVHFPRNGFAAVRV